MLTKNACSARKRKTVAKHERGERTEEVISFTKYVERDRENVPFEIRSDRLFTGEHRVTVVLVPASFVAENSSGRFYIRRAPWNPRHGFPTAIKFDSKCVWPFSAFKFRTLRIVRSFKRYSDVGPTWSEYILENLTDLDNCPPR